jgi:hypothetical protein
MISRRASCDSFGISEMISALLMLENYTSYRFQSILYAGVERAVLQTQFLGGAT